MAQRRMFAKSIIQSDAFLSLSPKSQCLYIQLNMGADDDGVVNNAKSIMATINCTKREYSELLDNKFIIEIDNITIIKHWRINNLIRSDRYKATNYKELFNKIKIEENGAYKICENGIPNDNQMTTTLDTQYSIGKDSIDKIKINNIDKHNNTIQNADPLLIYKNVNADRHIPNDEYLQLNDLIKEYGKENIKETIIQINEEYGFVTLDLINKKIKEQQQ